jgi:hypothetical protein
MFTLMFYHTPSGGVPFLPYSQFRSILNVVAGKSARSPPRGALLLLLPKQPFDFNGVIGETLDSLSFNWTTSRPAGKP